jgi:hypothetical protein
MPDPDRRPDLVYSYAHAADIVAGVALPSDTEASPGLCISALPRL